MSHWCDLSLRDAVRPQAEALGILGVNLIHSALTRGGDHYAIVSSLMDDLSRARLEVPPACLRTHGSVFFLTLQWSTGARMSSCSMRRGQR